MLKPRVYSYPKETVVAEKLQAIVCLGMQNSRMNDFFYLLWFSKLLTFDGPLLIKAIKATFKRRNTDIPSQIPIALSDEFSSDQTKQI